MLPIMSLLSTPTISHPSARARWATCRPPWRPCSSPESPVRMMLEGNRWALSRRAASSTPAIPEALSFAPGGVRLPVRRVRGPGVDVTRHDDVAVRVRSPPDHREHVHHPCVLGNPSARRHQARLVRHLQAPAAPFRDAVEFRLDPTARRPDPPRVGKRIGQRVPRTEAHERADVGLDPIGRRRLDDVQDAVVLRRRDGPHTLRRGGERGRLRARGSRAMRPVCGWGVRAWDGPY